MKYSRGAALLIVLSMTGLLSALLASVWFITSWSYDTILERERWYKNFYATEALLNIGIELIQKDFKNIIQVCKTHKKPVVIDVSHVFAWYATCKGLTNEHHGIMSVQAACDPERQKSLMITAHFMHNNTCIACHRCLLNKVSVHKNSGKEKVFVRSHYTLSTAV